MKKATDKKPLNLTENQLGIASMLDHTPQQHFLLGKAWGVADKLKVGIKDYGTCVRGMELNYKGLDKPILEQYWQGNMGNYELYKRVIEHFTQYEGFEKEDFTIVDGNMD